MNGRHWYSWNSFEGFPFLRVFGSLTLFLKCKKRETLRLFSVLIWLPPSTNPACPCDLGFCTQTIG